MNALDCAAGGCSHAAVVHDDDGRCEVTGCRCGRTPLALVEPLDAVELPPLLAPPRSPTSESVSPCADSAPPAPHPRPTPEAPQRPNEGEEPASETPVNLLAVMWADQTGIPVDEAERVVEAWFVAFADAFRRAVESFGEQLREALAPVFAALRDLAEHLPDLDDDRHAPHAGPPLPPPAYLPPPAQPNGRRRERSTYARRRR